MIVEEILTLPPTVQVEGVTFEMTLANDGGKHMQLYYPIAWVDRESPYKEDYDLYQHWKNKFYGEDQFAMWLVLYEKIETDADLLWAIRDCWYWLQKKGLLAGLGGSPYG